MAVTDPFVVKIPRGATEIDLRPVLEPILQLLARRGGCGIESARHGRSTSPHRSYSPEQMEAFMVRLIARQRLATRLSRLRPEWIHAYATERGWRTHDDYGHRQYNRDYDRFRPTNSFVVHKEADDPRVPGDCWAAVRSLADYERRRWDEVITDILAHGNAIDALGSLADGT